LFDQDGHPAVPTCAPTLSRGAAVQEARRASPKAARSVLDGCEHDGILIAETDDDATTPDRCRLHGRITTRRLDAGSHRRQQNPIGSHHAGVV
jgi:hypothetical protein